MKKRAARKPDYSRRDKIIRAARQVIAKEGVASTTHRKVTSVAKVPLGSMTYYFDGIDDLLYAAFAQFAEESSAQYTATLEAADTIEAARAALVEIMTGSLAAPENVGLSFEFYAYSVRHPAFRKLMQEWVLRSRKALERHFSARTARALDALNEGVQIHNTVAVSPISRAEARQIVERLTEE